MTIVFSLYWGIRSVILFTTDSLSRVDEQKQKLYFLRRKFPGIGTFLIGSYQFIFNFVGSFAGWVCFYVLLVRIQARSLGSLDFTGGDVLLFFVSLLGLSGHLPQILYGLVESVGELGNKAIEKMGG